MRSLPRVAVLDDDVDAGEAIAARLIRRGCNSTAFVDARQLLEADRRHAFDAFVLDWLLVDTSAATAAREIRQRGQRRPIFVLSGNLAVNGQPTDGELVAAIDSLDLRYRGKPYSASRLADEILDALKERGP